MHLQFLHVLLVPFLVIKLDVFSMLSARTMCLPYGWRVVSKICVTVVAKILGHIRFLAATACRSVSNAIDVSNIVVLNCWCTLFGFWVSLL